MNVSTINKESIFNRGLEEIANCFGHEKHLPDIFNSLVDSTIKLFENYHGKVNKRENLVKKVPFYSFIYLYGRDSFRRIEEISGENYRGRLSFSEALKLQGDPEELKQNLFALNVSYEGNIKNENFLGSFNLCFSPTSKEHLMYFIAPYHNSVQKVLPISFRLDVMSDKPNGEVTETTFLIPKSKSLVYSSHTTRNPNTHNDTEWRYSESNPEIWRWKKGDFIGVVNGENGLIFDYLAGQKEVIQILRKQAKFLEEQANIAEEKILNLNQ